jgi:isoamylase
MDWQLDTGAPFPLGATLSAKGCNFAIHAPQGHNLQLVLFDDNNQAIYIPLTKNCDNIYSVFVSDLPENSPYSYCIKTTQSTRWIIDPYASKLTTNPKSSDIPAAVVQQHHFDWAQSEKPNIKKEQTLIYELHVKGFTQQHPTIPEHLKGTYLGLCQPDVIAHFKQIGVTTLQLLPVTSSIDEPHLKDKELTNYWGYNPLCWFAPDAKFAVKDPVVELKTMVKILHENGIEVILDVVYNHTAESGNGGLEHNFKILAPKTYLMHRDGNYENYTGCGNTVDLSYPPALRTVMDSLRHWVNEYKIDGFRFDLAATLGRRGACFDQRAGFFQAIQQDPSLQNVKLIAEPWDIGPNGYQLGSFPISWNECNDKYRDTIRSFWNHAAPLGEFATRLMGSRDLFSASRWPDKLCVNYISYHDGFTMQDLVSYNEKHNLDNKESNRDGHGDNRSFNHGAEGETTNTAIIELREKQKRNLMTTLLFSFGIPHFLASDSFSHTQKGNNNAYCQDTELSWVNWDQEPEQADFMVWFGQMISARHQYMMPFINAFSGENRGHHRIHWMQSNGHILQIDHWHDHAPIALHLGLYKNETELLYLINPTNIPTRFKLPQGSEWNVVCDTSEHQLTDRSIQTTYMQSAKSITILHRK